MYIEVETKSTICTPGILRSRFLVGNLQRELEFDGENYSDVLGVDNASTVSASKNPNEVSG
jgi:hypothetical protein